MNSTTIIYATGCSWTAGAELLDQEVFTGSPGPVDLSSDYARTWGRDWFINSRMSQMQQKLSAHGPDWVFELADQERTRAWPARLATLTGHEVINAAVNGAGQEQILIQARKDLKHLHDVTVIAQLTSPYRWMYPNLYTEREPWGSILVSNAYDPKSPEYLAQQAFRAWPKQAAEEKWLNDILNLIDYCGQRGFKLHLIQAWNWEFNPDEYPELWQDIKPYLLSDLTVDQQFGHNQRNPGGHPTQQTHNELAQWLSEKL